MSRPVTTVIPPDEPLRALWVRYRAYRGRFVGAVVASTVNKVADVMPELLIGAAIDVVVRGGDSFVASVLEVESRFAQLGWLAAFNVVVWVVESLSEYVASACGAASPRRGARPPRRGLRPRAAPPCGVARDAAGRGDARHPQRRREPAGAVPRHRSAGDPADRAQRRARRRGLRGRLVAAVGARLPADPGHHRGVADLQRRLEPLYAEVRSAVADLSSALSANLAGITTIKAFTAEERERERISAISDAYRAANLRAIRSSAAFVPSCAWRSSPGSRTLLLGGGRAAR